MHAYRVPLNLRTVDDWIEFVVVQWAVPTPADLAPVPPDCVPAQRAIVEQLGRYLHANPSVGPRFMIFPEISVPFSMRQELETALLPHSEHPAILIAGIEHVNRTNHSQLTAQCDGAIQGQLEYSSDEPTRFYNDALVVVRAADQTRRYVQPKCQSWHEEPGLNHCADVLVFDLGPDATPFTFCVQICSDFNNPDGVAEFRRALKAGGIDNLDLTILIEHNHWQFNDPGAHIHLKQALAAYFSAEGEGTTKTRTAASLVLLANRPRDTHLATTFGGGGLVFRHSLWKPRSELLPSTYYWEDDLAWSLEHVFFRVQMPAIHRFKYRRRTATNAGTGAQQQSPFRDSVMTTARIDGAGLRLAETPFGGFCEIPPFDEALRRIAAACAAALSHELALAGTHPEVVRRYRREIALALASLRDSCRSLPTVAVTSFSTFLGSSGRRPRPSDPSLWTEAEERAVDRLVRAHALIGIGISCNGLGVARVMLSSTTQGRINDAADIAYVWCGGTEETGTALVRWLHEDAAVLADSPILVVGVDADPVIAPERFLKLREEITNVRETITGFPVYLRGPGAVTASGLERPHATYVSSLTLRENALQPGKSLKRASRGMRPHLQRCMTEMAL